MSHERLFIVSSRLPVCIDSGKENPIRPASSKLVNAIKMYLQGHGSLFKDFFWVGIPGCQPTSWNEATNHFFDSPYTYLPVLVFKEQYKKYHLGFAKSVIWPLFHGSASHDFKEEEYEQYISVNEHYAEILEKKCWENDTVWINDYHLLPLARMLRNKFPKMRIEFFLHIPFPAFELFRLLPENLQADILKGMIGADFIRLHSAEDVANLSEAVKMVLGNKVDGNIVLFKERVTSIDVFDNDTVIQSNPGVHQP